MMNQVGRRQAVRHGPLEPAFVGSNPTAPAAGMRAAHKEEGCRQASSVGRRTAFQRLSGTLSNTELARNAVAWTALPSSP